MLYIVATPIGNLKDTTLRALEVLEGADFILAEDTRVTKKLLSHYEIKTPLISYHQHTSDKKIDEIIERLKTGKTLALVTDSGTPGISDPGGKIVEAAAKEDIEISPIPGPSALSAAISISGLPMDKFVFMGFPPQKKKRKKYFKNVIKSDLPVIFYESPHRVLKTLKELQTLTNGDNYDIVVGRELTKMFESIYRGNISEVIEQIQKDKVKGEFTIIINKNGKQK